MKSNTVKTRTRRQRWLSQTARQQRVFEWIAGGWSLQRVMAELAKEPRAPASIGEGVLVPWLLAPARIERYREARAQAVERMVDDVLLIADTAAGQASSDAIRAAKLQIDTRRWLAGRWNPEWYADRPKTAAPGTRASAFEEALQHLAELPGAGSHPESATS